jgi:hypothetical protein
MEEFNLKTALEVRKLLANNQAAILLTFDGGEKLSVTVQTHDDLMEGLKIPLEIIIGAMLNVTTMPAHKVLKQWEEFVKKEEEKEGIETQLCLPFMEPVGNA